MSTTAPVARQSYGPFLERNCCESTSSLPCYKITALVLGILLMCGSLMVVTEAIGRTYSDVGWVGMGSGFALLCVGLCSCHLSANKTHLERTLRVKAAPMESPDTAGTSTKATVIGWRRVKGLITTLTSRRQGAHLPQAAAAYGKVKRCISQLDPSQTNALSNAFESIYQIMRTLSYNDNYLSELLLALANKLGKYSPQRVQELCARERLAKLETEMVLTACYTYHWKLRNTGVVTVLPQDPQAKQYNLFIEQFYPHHKENNWELYVQHAWILLLIERSEYNDTERVIAQFPQNQRDHFYEMFIKAVMLTEQERAIRCLQQIQSPKLHKTVALEMMRWYMGEVHLHNHVIVDSKYKEWLSYVAKILQRNPQLYDACVRTYLHILRRLTFREFADWRTVARQPTCEALV